jgi:hypothetical protein
MKLSASLVAVAASPVSSYTQKLASGIEPGQSFEMIDGSRLRILAKSASPDGLRIRVSKAGAQQTMSFQQFSALGVVSPAMRRLAHFIHRVVAFDGSLDTYVKEAIKAAGLPVDPSMDWNKYLGAIFNKSLARITKDPEVINDAIIDVVVDELYTKRMLQKDSPYAHFNPDHEKLQGKELASKVTAFLINIFKGRKQQAADTVRRVMGIGAGGSLGLVPADSLDEGTSSTEGNNDTETTMGDRLGKDDPSVAELEGQDEVHAFLDAFIDKTTHSQRKSTGALLNYITTGYAEGLDRDDIRAKFIADENLKARYPDKINQQGFNYLLRSWSKLIRDFAKDSRNPLANTDVARMVIRATDKLTDTDAKAVAVKSSLHLAEIEENGVPTNIPVPPVQAAPPPPNPNVQQQNNAKPQNGLIMAPAATGEDLNDGQPPQNNQPKKTISPEIPGVNHTSAVKRAPEPSITSVIAADIKKEKAPLVPIPAKTAAPVVATSAVKAFVALRQIAAEEPQELGLAFSQITASLRVIASHLHRASLNLDLVAPSKTASIREKITARNKFARALRRIAEESPEQIGEVLNDVYAELDKVVVEVENLADHLDVDLVIPESEEVSEGSVEAEPEPFESTDDALDETPEAIINE